MNPSNLDLVLGIIFGLLLAIAVVKINHQKITKDVKGDQATKKLISALAVLTVLFSLFSIALVYVIDIEYLHISGENAANHENTIPTPTPTRAIAENTIAIKTPTPTATPYTPKNYYVFQETRDSDCFSMVGYHESRQELLVCFRTTGVYFYFDVPKNVYNEFVSADSLGTYFNNNIKNNYRYERGNDMDNDYIESMLAESAYENFRDDWIADNYNEDDYDGMDPYDAFNDYMMDYSDEEYDFE